MTIPLLPPPTPTELAVIRARLEPREPFGPKGNRRWHRIVAYLVISLTPIVVMAVAPGRGPAGALAGTSLVAWFFGLQAWSRLRARRIDAAVGVRLEREGAAAGLPQRAADRLGRGAWVMMWLNVAYMTVLVVATLAWLGVRPSFGTLGVSAAVVASAVVQWWCLLDVVRTPAVGTGPVLIQVDAALTRREVWFVNTIALIPGWAVAGLVQFADGSPEWMIFVRLAYGPLSMASLFWWSLRSLDDKPLLEDYRLTTATPPKVWLAGEPA